MTNKSLTIGLVVVAIVAIIGIFMPILPNGKSVFGAVTGETNLNTLGVSGLKLGSACNDSFGSSGCQTNTKFASGACYPALPSNLGFLATSTIVMDCVASSVVSGDRVIAQFVSPYPGVNNQNVWATGVNRNDVSSMQITAAYASTTNGFITLYIFNGIGTATSSYAVGTSTSTPTGNGTVQYWVFK